MKRLDWKIAGAAGIVAGMTVGGFSFVSASGVDRAVRTIEMQGDPAASTAAPLLRIDDGTSSAEATFSPRATDSVSASPNDSAEIASVSNDSVSASLDSPEPTAATAPRATARPAAQPVAPAATDSAASADSSASVDSVASVDSIASVDSADSSD